MYDEPGRLRHSSVPAAVGIQVSDRDYFQRLRAGEPIVISPRLEERPKLASRCLSSPAAISRAGQFHGAASIAIPTKAMDEFWRPIGTGAALDRLSHPNRRIFWLVARHPQLPQDTWTSAVRPYLAEYLPAAPGWISITTPSARAGRPVADRSDTGL